MAGIRNRKSKDGSTCSTVEWRVGGGRTGKTATEPFGDKRSAARFGSLTTFPSVGGDDAVTHVVVPPSLGRGGKTNSPDAEGAQVVELICEHARTHPDESLGVITFGLVHARRIEDALEQSLLQHPELEEVLTSGAEPMFVKNIERVQDDERDAVILTVGYGKNAAGRLPLFWGPLLRPGGERRLNVAISRARNRMTLVSSFSAQDIAEDAHPSAGFSLMHRFLHFAASGGRELSRDGIRSIPLNPFEQDIFNQLTAAGLDLAPQLGVGQYRLDFAARHPDHPGRYVLAIEADGASYHSGHIARERDRLRRQLLEARGWVFHRIWSTDWFNEPHAQVDATVAAYSAALAVERQRDHLNETTPYPVRAPAPASDPLAGGGTAARDVTRPDQNEQPSWHMPTATRALPRPRLQPGQPIAKYSMRDLVALVRYVRSDGVLRTRDDEITLLMGEPGFLKGGSSIMAALTEAQKLTGS